jgi:hypothetical protein
MVDSENGNVKLVHDMDLLPPPEAHDGDYVDTRISAEDYEDDTRLFFATLIAFIICFIALMIETATRG